MKRCPQCRRDYTDETLNFCLDDGAALLDGPGSHSEPATAILHPPEPQGEATTRSHLTATDPTTVLRSGINDAPKRGIDKRLLMIPILIGAGRPRFRSTK